MYPDYQNQPAPQASKEHVSNALSVTQLGEVKICDIKRHPIGLFTIYILTGVMLLVIAVVAFGIAPAEVSEENRSSVMGIGAVVLLVLALISAIYGFIATKVYWGNSWVITSDSVTQVTQTSLFNRQSSQLSLGNLEDVSAEQNGILTHIFNYGVLKVETAGERSKFVFLYCPNPNYYAQQILAAREAFEQGRRSMPAPQTLYQEATAFQQQPQPPAGQYPSPPQPPQQPQPPAGQPISPPIDAYPDDLADHGVNTGTG